MNISKGKITIISLLVFLLGLVLIARYYHSQAEFTLYFLDVGQGDSILLRKGKIDILIDGGPDNSVLAELGKVRPAWDRDIEIVLLTHPDLDHVGGLVEVGKRYNLGLVILPQVKEGNKAYNKFISVAEEKARFVRMAFKGQEITVGDLSLLVVAPDRRIINKYSSRANNISAVVRGKHNDYNFLLSGDIESQVEKYLARESPSVLTANIFKVPHHGSKTSSSEVFIKKVNPEVAVISVGEENKFGHPDPQVLRLYEDILVLRTDLHGTISFKTSGEGETTLSCENSCAEKERTSN